MLPSVTWPPPPAATAPWKPAPASISTEPPAVSIDAPAPKLMLPRPLPWPACSVRLPLVSADRLTSVPAAMVMEFEACRVMLVLPRACSVPTPRLLVLSAKPTCGDEPARLPAVPPTMLRSAGSSSRLPMAPCAALVSTCPLKSSRPCEDTSTWPPLPVAAPPRASMLPAKSVARELHTTTWPPSPLAPADASSRAPAATVVSRACASGPWPCSPPPSSMLPPPCAPAADTRAWEPTASCGALMRTLPPCAPAACTPPSIATCEAPRMEMLPSLSTARVACCSPWVLTVARNRAMCRRAASPALMRAPAASSTPAARRLMPRSALTRPAMAMRPWADNGASPASRLATAASSMCPPESMRRMNARVGVDTARLPTLTTPEAPTTMPCGSANTTLPPMCPWWMALSTPSMSTGPPLTRLIRWLAASGTTRLTSCPCASRN